MAGAGEKRNPKPHYHGHRQRLKSRFLGEGGDSLPDYEILELLLFYAISRRDVKPLAKALIDRFGTLAAVLSAAPERLMEIEGVKESTVVLLRAARQAGLRLAREDVGTKPVFGSWEAVVSYCRAAMAYDDTERFRVLFLDRKNAIIADEVQQKGTVDHTPVYPREVVKRALELGATALILVHNHPSGDPEPSRADIEMTREVQAAAEALGISLHDHVVVGRSGSASFKSLGLF